MSQSLAQIYLHVVFSTKNRAALIRGSDLCGKLHGYLSGACANLECPAVIVGGTDDHVHLLCHQSKNVAAADLVRDIKRASSMWIKEAAPRLAMFQWRQGYGVFSISPAHVQSLTQYIQGQDEHHRQVSFQDELRTLCRKYGVELDERYAWD